MKFIITTLITLIAGFPFIVANAQSLHIVHCLQGCPTGIPASNDLIVREIYALSSNDTRKFADWVAYRVTSETIGTSASLNRTWRADPKIAPAETLEPNDYSGANTAHGYDRGHQAPLASFAGTVFWRTTNFLSNITPQQADLNQGPWKNLEAKIRDLAYSRGEVYVVTGPLYDAPTPTPLLPNSDETHTVPTGYWKIVSTNTGVMTAFVFDQGTARTANYCNHRSTLVTVETRSGLDLFPNATGWPTGDLRMELGC